MRDLDTAEMHPPAPKVDIVIDRGPRLYGSTPILVPPVAPRLRPRRTRITLRTRLGGILDRPVLGSLTLCVIAALAALVRLFLPFPSGLADNGDGIRYTCQVGVVPPGGETDRYFDHAILNWVASPDAGANCVSYPSSMVALLRLTQVITHAAGGADGSIDLRILLLGYSLLVGLLVGLFALVLRRGPWLRSAGTAALWIVLTDGTFADYAGSVYGELPGVVGIALLAVGAVFAGTAGGRQLLGYLLVAAGGLLTITSKTQGITVLLPLTVFLLATTMRRYVRTEPGHLLHRLGRTAAGKVVPVGIALALVVPATWVLDNNPKEFQAINPWELISVGILGNSHDPAGDLEEMGFPRSLERYAGDSVWTQDSILNSPQWDQNKSNMTYFTAADFLVHHPARALSILNNAGSDFLAARPDYLGSYTAETGTLPRSQSPSVVQSTSGQLAGVGIVPLLLIWGGMTWGAVALIRRSRPGSIRRSMAAACLLLVGVAAVQLGTAGFGEAIENTKHMVYGIMAGALALVFLGTSFTSLESSEPDLRPPRRSGRRRLTTTRRRRRLRPKSRPSRRRRRLRLHR